MIKVLDKPPGLLIGALGGVLAGALFKQLWKVVGGEEDAPQATDEDRSWREVLTAAALQGAVFALVKAAVDRGGAAGTRASAGSASRGHAGGSSAHARGCRRRFLGRREETR